MFFEKYYSNKLQEAIYTLKQLEIFSQKVDYQSERIYALNMISFILLEQKKYEEALAHLDSTNRIIRDLTISTSSISSADLFYLYGLTYKRIGRFKSALYFYEKTIESPNFKNFNFRPDDLSENIARMISEQGDYKKSERYFHQAISEINAAAAISNRDISNRYKHTGKNYELWNDPQKAYKYYQLALNQLPPNTTDTVDIEQRISIYAYLAEYHAKYNQLGEAYQYLKKANKLIFNDKQLLTYTKKLAFLKKQEGVTEEAIKIFESALKLSKNIYGETHTNHGALYLKIGALYAAKGQHHQALQYYQQSLSNIIWNYNDSTILDNPNLLEINAPLAFFQTLELKAASLAEIGNLPKTLKIYQLAATFIELQCNHYLTTKESRLFWIAKAKPIYEKAIEIALKLDRKKVVFDFIQRGHSLLLLHNMQQAEAIFNASLPDSLKKQDLSYKMSKSALDTRLLIAQKENNQEKIQQLEIQQLALERKNEQFHKYLKKHYSQYAQAVSTFSHKPIETIRQEVLSNKNALIEYFIGEQSIYSMVLTQDDLQIFKTHKSENFVNQITTFRQLIQQYDYSLQAYIQFCKTGFDLYEILLKQALIQLPPSIDELIIIPDEYLNYIPFAATLDTPVDVSEQIINYFELPYLINKYAISYNYSSSLFGKLVNEGNTHEVVGFAPSFGGAYSTNRNLDSLIYNTAEIQIVDSIIGGQMYLKDAATLAAFKENITHSNILHLATHASVNDSLPMDSYIYFSKDSLPIHEIPTFQQSLNLAVLSACETGKGMLKKGEGMITLARAFIQSGCPSVITSLWKVNDPKTPALMKHFYLELKSGKSINVALSIAQKNYMREEAGSDAYAHPYYWATFIQIGNTNPLFVDKKYLTLLFTATLIGAFLLFIVWKFIFK